jgi:hypothetical protein
MTYEAGKPSPALEQAQKCYGLNRLMESQSSFLDNRISNDNAIDANNLVPISTLSRFVVQQL